MRAEWMSIIRSPYTKEEQSDETRLQKRLGLELPSTNRLIRELLDDLDEEVRGFGWWESYGSTYRRILVSDYTQQAASSIPRNLLEATVHLLEAQSAWDREGEWVELSIRSAPAGHPFAPPRSAEDELHGIHSDLHVAGFYRAIGSALDCLAALLIGVGALELEIFGTTWRSSLRRVRQLAQMSPDEDPRRDFARSILSAQDLAGPKDWLTWTIALRNMLVHRARRMNIRLTMPRGRLIAVDEQGRKYRPLRVVPASSKDPSLSEVEVMLEGDSPLEVLLHETSEETMTGALRSVTTFVEEASGLMLEFWRRRRINPSLVMQPLLTQWPGLPRTSHDGFVGYAPKTFSSEFLSMIAVHPNDGKRMKAAAVLDHERHRWKSFLEEEESGSFPTQP
jgi:hypothetical protein